MILGLLADIHEDVERLARAVDLLRAEQVERFVVLGDVFGTGKHLAETVALLAPLESVGVWGNHDFGLCGDVSERTRQRFPAEVIDYFATLKPFLEIDGCWFQHIEPFLDSESLEDLWSYGGEGKLDAARAFAARPHRRFFMGHVHRWECDRPDGVVPWDGSSELKLDANERYLLAVHAVVNGWCATYGTGTDVLTPIRITP